MSTSTQKAGPTQDIQSTTSDPAYKTQETPVTLETEGTTCAFGRVELMDERTNERFIHSFSQSVSQSVKRLGYCITEIRNSCDISECGVPFTFKCQNKDDSPLPHKYH